MAIICQHTDVLSSCLVTAEWQINTHIWRHTNSISFPPACLTVSLPVSLLSSSLSAPYFRGRPNEYFPLSGESVKQTRAWISSPFAWFLGGKMWDAWKGCKTEEHIQYFGICTTSSPLTKSSPVLWSSPATWQTLMAQCKDETDERERTK